MNSRNSFGAEIKNVSSEYGQVAIQGPRAIELLSALSPSFDPTKVPYFCFTEGTLSGISVIAAHTGYTGEDGFELFVPVADTVKLWDLLVEKGKSFGIIPAGLGARDSLRLEACLPLHGHELGDEITAIESGLGWIVKPQKGDFIAKAILEREKQNGAARSLVGFFVEDTGIARAEDNIFAPGGTQPIGVVTSGTKTPTVNKALGLALVDSAHKAIDTALEVEVRGRRLKAKVVKVPFYKRTTR
jgi:aminomethyltransferase